MFWLLMIALTGIWMPCFFKRDDSLITSMLSSPSSNIEVDSLILISSTFAREATSARMCSASRVHKNWGASGLLSDPARELGFIFLSSSVSLVLSSSWSKMTFRPASSTTVKRAFSMSPSRVSAPYLVMTEPWATIVMLTLPSAPSVASNESGYYN